MRRSGSRLTFVKITRLMSDQLKMALVLGNENGPSNPIRSIRLALFCFLSDLPMRLESWSWVIVNLSQVEESLERYNIR
jgi:hypothetical protein